ncbi:MAG: PIN domain-containing protein [Candidatus Binatia bacterium]
MVQRVRSCRPLCERADRRRDGKGHCGAAAGAEEAGAHRLATLRSRYAHRILPIDATIAAIWGRTAAAVERRGGTLGVVDGLIAATAIHHGYTVVTRNAGEFALTGVALLNVWQQ